MCLLLTDLISGISLRELIHEFKHQTLVLFKCCLLQPKVASRPLSSSHILILTDALLRFEMRATLHGSIRADFFDTRFIATLGRLRRSRFRFL